MYLVLKLVHVSAVILFLGNIVTGLFWKAHGDRSGAPSMIAHMFDGIIRSDRYFTLPSVVVITVSGLVMAHVGHIPIFGTAWIWMSLILFAISGIIFGWQVAPLQRRLRALARDGAGDGLDLAAYRRLSLRWELCGLLALVTPVAAVVLMVLKPAW